MTRKDVADNLEGIFLPVVTPFNRSGGIDEGRFRENLRRYAYCGLSGIVVAGSTGEAPYLTERERLRLVDLARGLVRAPQLLVAGTGLESTSATIALSREVAARGADLLLVVTPGYYRPRMDSAALVAHYRAVADRVPRPVEIYSIPQFTGVHIDADVVARLSRHPNIVGIKESSGNLKFVRSTLRKVPAWFRLLVGAATIIFESLRAGAAGGVLGLAGFVPELCVGLYEAFRRGQFQAARALEARLTTLIQKISNPYGISGIKAALELRGYADGAPRAPLMPLGHAGRRAVRNALREACAGLEI